MADNPRVFNRKCNSRCVGEVHADLLYTDIEITLEWAQAILDANDAGVQLLTLSPAHESPSFNDFFGKCQVWECDSDGKTVADPSVLANTHAHLVTYRLID